MSRHAWLNEHVAVCPRGPMAGSPTPKEPIADRTVKHFRANRRPRHHSPRCVAPRG
jgi:hypothetical protein